MAMDRVVIDFVTRRGRKVQVVDARDPDFRVFCSLDNQRRADAGLTPRTRDELAASWLRRAATSHEDGARRAVVNPYHQVRGQIVSLLAGLGSGRTGRHAAYALVRRRFGMKVSELSHEHVPAAIVILEQRRPLIDVVKRAYAKIDDEWVRADVVSPSIRLAFEDDAMSVHKFEAHVGGLLDSAWHAANRRADRSEKKRDRAARYCASSVIDSHSEKAASLLSDVVERMNRFCEMSEGVAVERVPSYEPEAEDEMRSRVIDFARARSRMRRSTSEKRGGDR